MIGLMHKDLCILANSYKKNLTSIFVLYTILALFLKMSFFGYLFGWILGLYIVSSVSMDHYSKWDLYASCLPITSAQIVGAKSLLILFALLLGLLYSIVLCLIAGLLEPQYSLTENIFSSFVCFLLALPYFGFSLALSYKFSPEKARSAMMTGLVVFIGLGLLLSASDHSSTALFQLVNLLNKHFVLFAVGIAAACILLYLLSWFLAAKWYQQKEF